MPATRRSRTSGGPAVRGSQSTLSFGHSKVTKPTSGLPSKEEYAVKEEVAPPTKQEIAIDVGHTNSEAAVAQQAAAEIERLQDKTERTPEEARALKVTDAQIKRYWKEREAERKAKRVHQGNLSLEEKVLRFFDISSQYGVCLPISSSHFAVFVFSIPKGNAYYRGFSHA
jgi:DNA polymerase delta subunit 4